MLLSAELLSHQDSHGAQNRHLDFVEFDQSHQPALSRKRTALLPVILANLHPALPPYCQGRYPRASGLSIQPLLDQQLLSRAQPPNAAKKDSCCKLRQKHHR